MCRKRFPTRCVRLQLLALLVHTYHGTQWVVRTLVHIKYIFHLGNEPSAHFGYAPTLDLPGSKPVFFSRFMTQVSDICSTYPSSTILSANNCKVHLPLPSGGVEQASMTILASASPSMTGGLPLRALSYKAVSKPPSTNCCLTRDTVLLHNCRACAMAWFELVLRRSPPRLPTLRSAAISKMRARVCTRAGLLPLFTNCLSVARSSLVTLISGAVLILLLYHTGVNFVGVALSEAKNLEIFERVLP